MDTGESMIVLCVIVQFGRVHRCKHKGTGEYYAMKILKKSEIIAADKVDKVIR